MKKDITKKTIWAFKGRDSEQLQADISHSLEQTKKDANDHNWHENK